MQEFLTILHIIVSVLLIVSVLSQNRSAGLSATFGGGGSFYAGKRGAEKVLYIATMVLAALYVGIALVFLFV